MRTLLLLFSILVAAPPARAQVPLKGELARLGFMVGEWRGTAWVRYAPDGPVRAARVTGQGQPRLAGVVLGWTSTATSTDGTAATVASSDLMVRFRADSAVFRATVQHGSAPVQAWVVPGACEMSWGYASPADAQSRFRFTSKVQGARRVETGERSGDGGRTWWAFYGAEMTGTPVAGCEDTAAPASEKALPRRVKPPKGAPRG